MLMEALRRVCSSFLPSSWSLSPSVSSRFSLSSFLPISRWTAETSCPPGGASTFSPSSHHQPGSITPMTTAATLYKILAFLALLSMLPSSPPCSTTASMVKEGDLQKMFKLRNEGEWKSLWHQEKHVRCRDQLLTHMDWACQKDIYRLEKRFKGNTRPTDPLGDIFLGKEVANMLIKPWSGYARRKREEKSITDECCSANGCTWEEYAEYCPAHRRLQTRRYGNIKRRK